jgi:PAS domain-containing protein
MNSTLDLPSLVQAAGDAIIAADTDGKIRLWNPAAERMFGFTAEEAVLYLQPADNSLACNIGGIPPFT